MPAFAWEPAAGVDRYDFQIAADSGFTTPLAGVTSPFRTRNTRATVNTTVPNGTYWWRVRSVSATAEVSAWSPARSFEHDWSSAPTLLAPVGGQEVVYPAPLVLRWSPVPRARTYVVSVARDPAFASLVGRHETDATSFAYPALLTPGTTYFWGVTPLDGGRHPGAPSVVASFRWVWPSTMASAPRVRDLADDYPQIFDPEFSWDAVPGAARYQVEMWSSDQPDLKVCCPGTNIGTSLVPKAVLSDNTYFWRVRALDAAGEAGDWNDGSVFTKAFGRAQVQSLRMRDHLSDPGTDVDPAAGYQTRVPIVRWDPFPGASSYQVEVTPFVSDRCNWTATSSHWNSITATTAWSPLGVGWNGRKPYDDPRSVVRDSAALVEGASYCVRIRPRDVDATAVVAGDYTELNPGGPAFQWLGYPEGEQDCTPWPECNDGYLATGSYVQPARGGATTRMPLFAWRPLAGYTSYFVLVAKDPSFHTVVDYAFTRLPAYAPRSASAATTYQDETTHYYWAVLPAIEPNGNLASGNPLAARASDFQKLSVPPTLLAPADGAVVAEPPTFEWAPVEGARRYRLEVSDDPSFSPASLLEPPVNTNATGYTANTTYPSDAVVYWRVRGEDDGLHAMTWSPTRTLQRPLAAPGLSAPNPTSGDFVPTLAWDSVRGAVSYDVDVVQTSGTPQLFAGRSTTGFTPASIFGTGVWKWRVRARFPAAVGQVQGPYTDFLSFTRELPAPGGATVTAGARHVVLEWQPEDGLPGGNGVREYRVQTSARPDFSTLIEDDLTDNTRYAPLFTHFRYTPGETVYWRVAAVDGGLKTGGFTAPRTFTVPATASSSPEPQPEPQPQPQPVPQPQLQPQPQPQPPAQPQPQPQPQPTPRPQPQPEPQPPAPQPPRSKTASRTTVSVKKKRKTLTVRGRVTPTGRGRVAVTLFRKRNGAFARVASKTPMLTRAGAFAPSFPRPQSGMCKAAARYGGDASHRPSQATTTFRC
jgi:hypothetical protein